MQANCCLCDARTTLHFICMFARMRIEARNMQEARKVCEERLAKEGKLEDKDVMCKCCDNMILVADIKKNRRLVEMCTTNGKVTSSQRSGAKKK